MFSLAKFINFGGGVKPSLLMAGATLAVLTPFKSVQAAIIDFESLAVNNDSFNEVGSSYTEDGFTLSNLSSDLPFAVFGTQEPRYPGSTALFDNTVDGVTKLNSNSNSLFNLNSIDLTSLTGDNSVSVTFTGIKADFSTVTQSFTTDAILSTLETFTFSSQFTNLVSVSWIQAAPFHQFDNINVTPVPEPLTMLGAGTAIAFGANFKRKLAKNSKKK